MIQSDYAHPNERMEGNAGMIIHRIRASLTARMQNWASRHFELTKAGRELAKYKDIHKGERCFIIGNGPSLNIDDLETLHKHGIVTFATNRIFHIFGDTSWRPTYYASEDITILKNIQDEIFKVPCSARFIPVNLKWYENVDIPNATYFYMDYQSDYSDTYGLSLDASKAVRCRGTVTISCIQLALYMGFKEIYLLGVDHNYSKFTDANGNIVEDSTVKDYFSTAYDSDFKAQIVRDLGSTTQAFFDIAQLSTATHNFKIYNATRGGKLEVFQRVDFDSLFNSMEA